MFKLYYKIVRANKHSILTYAAVFLAIFVLFAAFAGDMNSQSSVYEQEKPSIAIIDRDDSELSKALVKQLKKSNEVISYFTNENDIRDGLFFGQIDAIVELPENFENDYEAGKENLMKLELRPEDASGVLIEQKVNSFLTSIRSYRSVDASLSYNDAASLVSKDLDKKAEITFIKEKKDRKEDMMRNLYYNFLSYVLFSIIVMTLGAAMHSIYRSEILKRTLISPINSTSMNIKLVFANISFGLILWGIFTAIILMIRHESMFTEAGLIYIINSLVFTLLCICFAFMATSLFSNKRNAHTKLDMLTNIFGLVGSFFGGAFLPQQFMPDNILQIARFLPNYWYVKLNDTLMAVSDVSEDIIKIACTNIGIQLLFAIAFLCIGLVIMKSKRSQDVIIDNDFE